MRIQPYRTLENVIEGAVITFMDITEIKEINQVLKINEARLLMALSNTPIMVYNQDVDLGYTWVHNPIPGFTVELLQGKTDLELFPEQEAAELTALKQQVFENGKGLQKNVHLTVDGKTNLYDLTIEPLLDAHNTIIGITGGLREITNGEEAKE